MELLVAEATMSLLLGDSWGRPKAAQGREGEWGRIWGLGVLVDGWDTHAQLCWRSHSLFITGLDFKEQ